MAIYRCTLRFLLVTFLVSFCYAEIRLTEIRNDDRPIIPFDEFGFTHMGRLELNVSKITLSDLNPDLDMSKVGFFLCTRDSWMQVLLQLEEGYIDCAIDSDFVNLIFRFNSLKGNKTNLDALYQENNADQYTLVFANCLNNVKVSMDVRSAMYNLDGKDNHRDYLSAGRTVLPRIFFLFALFYFIMAGIGFMCST